MSLSYNTALEIVGVLQMWSGFFLMKSVLSIRRFFIDHNAQEFINTRMLLRHATAFGLYITCTAAFFTVLSMYVWSPSTTLYNYTAGTGIFFNCGSFISQVLLFNIFWDLSVKIEKPRDRFLGHQDVEIAEFDEDAELQANMWNSMVRQETLSPDDQRNFVVTGESLLMSHRASIAGQPLPEAALNFSRRSTFQTP
jgi:hypothetical protein